MDQLQNRLKYAHWRIQKWSSTREEFTDSGNNTPVRQHGRREVIAEAVPCMNSSQSLFVVYSAILPWSHCRLTSTGGVTVLVRRALHFCSALQIGNKVPAQYYQTDGQQGASDLLNPSIRNIARKDFLGGLLKSYSRKAA